MRAASHRPVARALRRAAASCAAARPRARRRSGRVGGVVKDEGGQPIKGATITRRESRTSASTLHGDDRRQGPVRDHRPARRRVDVHRAGARILRRTPASMHVRIGGRQSADRVRAAEERRRRRRARRRRREGSAEQLAAADALFKQQKWDEAIAATARSWRRRRRSASINLQIGAAYRNKKDYDAAHRRLQRPAEGGARQREGAGRHRDGEHGEGRRAGGGRGAARRAAAGAGAGRDVFYSLGEIEEREDADRRSGRAGTRRPPPPTRRGASRSTSSALIAMKKGDKAGAAQGCWTR